MLGLNEIHNLIKANEAPYWTLNLMQGLDKVQAGAYNCENVKEDASDEERINRSIEYLDSILENFKDAVGQVFAIQLKKSQKASGGSVFGWFQFKVNPGTEQKTEHAQGLGSVRHDDGHNLEKQLLLLKKEMQLEFDRQMFDREKKEFEAKKKQALGEISAKQADVDSKSAPIAAAFQKLLMGFLGPYMGAEEKGLGAVEDDPRLLQCEAIAQRLYDSPMADEQLVALQNSLANGNSED